MCPTLKYSPYKDTVDSNQEILFNTYIQEKGLFNGTA